MGSSRSKATRTKRNPTTGQKIGASKPAAPTPEQLAAMDAKAAKGQRRGINAIENDQDMKRYVDACIAAIAKGSPMTIREIHAGLVKHFGLAKTHQVVNHYLASHSIRIEELRNGKK